MNPTLRIVLILALVTLVSSILWVVAIAMLVTR
jgi:hypothetical protein